MQTFSKNITPPSQPGEWSLAQIQEAFKRKLPSGMLKKLPSDKGSAFYLPWYRGMATIRELKGHIGI
jgi:hypothetical protein